MNMVFLLAPSRAGMARRASARNFINVLSPPRVARGLHHECHEASASYQYRNTASPRPLPAANISAYISPIAGELVAWLSMEKCIAASPFQPEGVRVIFSDERSGIMGQKQIKESVRERNGVNIKGQAAW